jgi:hypothetical protein
MMKIRTPISVLRRAARRGDQGFPMGTVAFYGPDDRRASKVVLGIIAYEGAEPQLHKWNSETGDLRQHTAILQQIINRMREHGVKSVAMVDRIIGCPHEEGIDYPAEQVCPQCSFWRGRNRFTGEYEM